MNDRHGSSTGRLLTRRPFGQRLSIVSLLVSALALGCNGGGPTDPCPGVVGSGNFVTESRSISGFNGVSASVGTLIIEQTGIESLTITADDNILPLLRTDVVGGRLELGLASKICNIRNGRIVYELTVRDLNEVRLGAASTVEITRIDTPLLDVTLGAVAFMTIVGTADKQNVDISGPSSYEAAGLQSREVRITASGPSITRVRVSERLEVTGSVPAVVEYFGNPEVSITGNVAVRRVGD